MVSWRKRKDEKRPLEFKVLTATDEKVSHFNLLFPHPKVELRLSKRESKHSDALSKVDIYGVVDDDLAAKLDSQALRVLLERADRKKNQQIMQSASYAAGEEKLATLRMKSFKEDLEDKAAMKDTRSPEAVEFLSSFGSRRYAPTPACVDPFDDLNSLSSEPISLFQYSPVTVKSPPQHMITSRSSGIITQMLSSPTRVNNFNRGAEERGMSHGISSESIAKSLRSDPAWVSASLHASPHKQEFRPRESDLRTAELTNVLETTYAQLTQRTGEIFDESEASDAESSYRSRYRSNSKFLSNNDQTVAITVDYDSLPFI